MPPRIGSHRAVASGFLASLHLTLAAAYAFPALTRGYPPPPDVRRISVVLYIDSLGPTWQIGFGLTGLLLGFAVVFRHRLLALAHTMGGAAVAVYATALWFGFAFSDPPPAVTTALGYTGLMVWHLTIGVTYARLADLPHSAVVIPEPPPASAPPPRTRHRKGRR